MCYRSDLGSAVVNGGCVCESGSEPVALRVNTGNTCDRDRRESERWCGHRSGSSASNRRCFPGAGVNRRSHAEYVARASQAHAAADRGDDF